jgi:hypothetical protein
MSDASSARMRGHAFWTSEAELGAFATFAFARQADADTSADTRQARDSLVSSGSWYILFAARELLVRFARKAVDCAVLSLWMTLVKELL